MYRGDILETKLHSLDSIGKALEHELDFNFSVSENKINTLEDFNSMLKEPFYNSKRKIFYRGERINSPERRLIPTLLRKNDNIFRQGESIVNIDYDFLLNYYREKGAYLDFYRYVFGKASKYRMFEICSFSQHYLDESPFIDFTKSLFVALSFALKDRSVFDDDIVIYSVEIDDDENYTDDIVTAECWLHDYKVTVFNSPEKIMKQALGTIKPFKSKEFLEAANERAKSTSPTAKFIDIPTNDLIKFQRGVFLLLTDFTMFYNSYLTKSIRDNFKIVKYVINRDICLDLLDVISNEAPWYQYDSIYDINKAITKVSQTDNHYSILKKRLKDKKY